MAATNSNRQMTGKAKLWLPVLAFMAIIFYVSSAPGDNLPNLFSFQDVVFHFSVYFMLSFFFCRALKNTYLGLSAAKVVLFGIIFGVMYGFLDEFHQAFVPGRSVSGFDVFIDGIGSSAGCLIFRWLK